MRMIEIASRWCEYVQLLDTPEANQSMCGIVGLYLKNPDLHDGRRPAGISRQDEPLARRLDPKPGGRRLANYLRVMTLECQTIARACGESHVHHPEPEDLVALTIEAAAMAKVPPAGTNWIPGTRGE